MYTSQRICRASFVRVTSTLLLMLAWIVLDQNGAFGQRVPSPEQPQQSHKLNLRFPDEQPRPLAMVWGDFDEDGVDDLVIGYGLEKGGSIALLRGNLDAIAPQTQASWLAAGRHEYSDPFLQRSRPILLRAEPSLMASADVNGDGHLDLVYASKGGSQLHVMFGTGHGTFLPQPISITVPGGITALAAYRPGAPIAGEALVVGFESRQGARLGILSYGTSGLSMSATYALPSTATMLTAANLDADYVPDTAIVAGGELMVLHGMNAIRGGGRLEVLPVDGVETVASGEFLFDRHAQLQLSVLTSRGEVIILAHQGFDPRPYSPQQIAATRHNRLMPSLAQQAGNTGNEPWIEVESHLEAGIHAFGSDVPILLRSRFSGSGADDLVVLNPLQQQRVVIGHRISAFPTPVSASTRISVNSISSDSAVAALSMRVSPDGRSGLVVLHRNDPSPEFIVPSAGNTLYVNTTADNTGTTTDPDDGTRCTSGSGETCTLRDAVTFANNDATDNISNGKSDTIMVPAGTYNLTWQAGSVDSNGNALTHLEVLGPVTIVGVSGTIIDAQSNDTIFTINPGELGSFNPSGNSYVFDVTFDSVAMQNGKNNNNLNTNSSGLTNYVGGGMNWDAFGTGTLTLTSTTVENCTVEWGPGGGIWTQNSIGGSGVLQINSSTISNNSTPEQGGAVYVAFPAVAVSSMNSTFSGNKAQASVNSTDPGADGTAGGLFLTARESSPVTPQTTLSGATISSNTADVDGGGIFTNTGILLGTSIVSNNSAGRWGGGVFAEEASPEAETTISSTNVLNNSATTTGGGLAVGPDNPSSGDSMQVNLSRIFGNTSTNGTSGLGLVSPGAAVATNNWWGCNAGPGNTGCDGADSAATTSPYAQFILSATPPTTITLGGSIGLSITLNTNSSSQSISPFPAVATNYPYTLSVSGVTATFPSSGTFDTTGSGTATITPTDTGSGIVSTTFDNQMDSLDFTVNAATQTITFGSLPNVTYGVSPITLMATASSGLPVSYSVTGPATVAGSILTITGAGMVSVTASQAGNTSFPAATPVTQSFTVNKAPLLVTANNASRPIDTPNPPFSYTITGFVNGDTVSVVSGTATETTTATITSPAGSYPITFSVEALTAANYTFSYVGGILTVAGKSQTTIASLTSTTATINVFGFGFTPPSGQLSFTDVTSGNPVAAPVTLNTATAATSLLPQVTTSTGADTLPVWTTLADLNGDGKTDLVTSLYLTDSVSVQLGNGDGTFQAATNILIASGFGPAENHLVSLRGNGTLDLIVASFNTNQIAVLLGNGNGTFQSPLFYTVGSATNTPTSLTTGDFNHDGNPDVALANTGDDTVSILLGNGSGALVPSGAPIPVGRDPEAIRAGDFNDDGYSDLVVANYGDGTITTLLNNQNGTFTAATISVGSGPGSGPQALAINGSGSSLLLAVANYNDNTVSVLPSNGGGGFGAQTIVNVGKGPDDVNFADFNGDGIPDLAVSNYTSDTVSLVLRSSGGNYTALGPFNVGDGPYSAAVGDLDQDGTPDIVVSNCFSNNTGVLLSGTQISVPYSGLSLSPGNTLNATYTPDTASKYGSSTSPNVTAP